MYMFGIILLKYNENGFKNKLRQTDFAPLVRSSIIIIIPHSLFSTNNAAAVSCLRFCFLIFLNVGKDHVFEF